MEADKIKKVISISLAILLVVNLVLFSFGLYDSLIFWLIIAAAAVPSFTILKKPKSSP